MNCKICFEKYNRDENKPITLMPCGHSLCAKCLFEIKKSFIHYNCPACRNTVSCEKPNFDLIELNQKAETVSDTKKSINKELKDYKELFKIFCSNSEKIFQESLANKEQIQNEINRKADDWIQLIKQNQNVLLEQAETFHKILSEKLKKCLDEQMTRQIVKAKSIKTMESNELIEFRTELHQLKINLSNGFNELNAVSTKYEMNTESINDFLIKRNNNNNNNNSDNNNDDYNNGVKNYNEKNSDIYDESEKSIQIIEPPKIVKELTPIKKVGFCLEKIETAEEIIENTLVCGYSGSSVKVWSLKSGECVNDFKNIKNTGLKTLTCMDIISNKYLVTGSEDKTIQVWDLESNQLKHTLIGHVNTIECILNLSGTSLISCAAYPERAIRIWDLESGKCINSVTDIHNGGVFSLCLLNNDTLLSGGGYGSIKFTNLNTKTRVKLLKGHTSKIVNMKILNENILISGSEDKIIKTWSILDEQVLNEIKFGDYFHRIIQISASKMMLLTTSDDVNIKMWSISTGECVNQLEGHSNLILTIKLINDNILASGSWDTTIKIWNLEQNACIKTLIGHKARVYNIQVINKDIIISFAHDKTIKVWKWQKGECLTSLNVETSEIKYLNHFKIN